MRPLRTPDKYFKNLPGWDFEPNYIQLDDTRMHYVDEGDKNGETVLCLHGEPSWSYLYRKMIPTLSENHRVLAPDLIGFGRSDKYRRKKKYSYKMHITKLTQFLDALELQDITLVVQDWGGLLGLGLLGQQPERFKCVVIMNTGLPNGTEPVPKAFKVWQRYAKYAPNLPVGKILQRATYSTLTDDVVAAYDAPFPSWRYKAGAKIFPALVPTSTTDPAIPYMLRAREVLKNWEKPALILFAEKDPILGKGWQWFQENIPSVQNRPRKNVEKASHFLQEDKGEEIAADIVAFMAEG